MLFHECEFDDFNLIPSTDTNSFSFNNYYRKQNFTDRVVYNGNASFFLEPMEATSVGCMDHIQRISWEIWNNNMDVNLANDLYIQKMKNFQLNLMSY